MSLRTEATKSRRQKVSTIATIEYGRDLLEDVSQETLPILALRCLLSQRLGNGHRQLGENVLGIISTR